MALERIVYAATVVVLQTLTAVNDLDVLNVRCLRMRLLMKSER